MRVLEYKASDSVGARVADSDTLIQSSGNDKADALGRLLTL
jgi:hypothetical protein